MTTKELSEAYKQQSVELNKKIDELRPMLVISKGNNLVSIRRKMMVYQSLAIEAEKTAELLSSF